MHVLSAVLVVVCVVQGCQGASLPERPISLLHHVFPAPAPPETENLATYSLLKTNDYIALEKYLKSIIKEKEMKYQISSATNTLINANRPDKGRAKLPVPVSLTNTKPSDMPCRSRNPSLWEAEIKAKNSLHLSSHVKPLTSHNIPEVLPAGLPCKDHRKHVPNIATAPPNVCDLCPDVNGKNPLDPCTVRTQLLLSTYMKGVWQKQYW